MRPARTPLRARQGAAIPVGQETGAEIMSANNRVVLVGCGNMGFAMLQGWLASETLEAGDVFVVEPNDDLRKRAANLGVSALAEAGELPGDLDRPMVILAVKPQMMDAVLPAYRDLAARGAAIVSVAAGTLIGRFEQEFGAATPVIRVMPNTPAAVGAGMMVICANGHVDAATMDFTKKLMAASGEVAVIDDESQMDAVYRRFRLRAGLPVPHDRGADRCGQGGRPAGRHCRPVGRPDDLRRGGLCQKERHGARHAARTGHQPERNDGGGAVGADGRRPANKTGDRGSRSGAGAFG
jgi:predicted dinucleotide-binding enzyme